MTRVEIAFTWHEWRSRSPDTSGDRVRLTRVEIAFASRERSESRHPASSTYPHEADRSECRLWSSARLFLRAGGLNKGCGHRFLGVRVCVFVAPVY